MGGGESETFITEAKTTMFHRFFRTKILAPGESVSDFIEVTEAERQKLLDALATWKRPPQVFIDMWNKACGIWGSYNEETGYFELNGLTDITYEEALEIFRISSVLPTGSYSSLVRRYAMVNNNITSTRTLMPICIPMGASIDATYMIASNRAIQTLRFTGDTSIEDYGCVKNMNGIFQNASTLRWVYGIISIGDANPIVFANASGLKHVQLKYLKSNLNISACALIDSESLNYAIQNRSTKKTSPITFTVHADVYAKLTGDTTNSAVAALSPEELAEWTALPALAAEKNITFVSA